MSEGEFIDTHAHLEMMDDIQGVIERAKNKGVTKVIAVSSDVNSSIRSIELSDKYPMAYSAVGIHPHEATGTTEEAISEIERLAENSKVIGIGETGLDYHYTHSDKEHQLRSFRMHIELASQLNLPLIIHIRDAFEDVLDVLRERVSNNVYGVIHCFTGDYETAKRFLDLGFYISFSGIVTFKNAEVIREAVRNIPINSLLLETDSPYLAPVPFRGKKNEPSYLLHVAEIVSEIRGASLDMIADVTTANAIKLFRFDKQRGHILTMDN